jgi:hypothetical protein
VDLRRGLGDRRGIAEESQRLSDGLLLHNTEFKVHTGRLFRQYVINHILLCKFLDTYGGVSHSHCFAIKMLTLMLGQGHQQLAARKWPSGQHVVDHIARVRMAFYGEEYCTDERSIN